MTVNGEFLSQQKQPGFFTRDQSAGDAQIPSRYDGTLNQKIQHSQLI